MQNTNITPKRIDFLRLLTRTGFASTRHLEEAGIVTNATRYSQSAFFKPMLESHYIGRMTVVSPYGIGKRVMYYLTRKGADFIAEVDGIDPDHVRYTPLRGGIIRAADAREDEQTIRANFPHKEAYVSVLIAIERYLVRTDYRIDVCYHDYDRRNGGTSLALGGKKFRPDGVTFLDPITPTMARYVFLIELHRHSDRKKIIEQLKRHVAAMKAQSVAQRFGYSGPYFVLSLYSNENRAVMHPVIETLKKDAEVWPYIERFLCSRMQANSFRIFTAR